MKVALIVAALVGFVSAEPPSSYGLPTPQGGQVFRHVYVHSAPDFPEDQQARVIRIPGGQNKHVNIIFVKTPSQSANQQTEVILPEKDEQKTVVYVLHRKFDPTTDLKIRAPRPQPPTKPDVYFIRYKENNGAAGYSGASPPPSSSSSTGSSSGAYGAPY